MFSLNEFNLDSFYIEMRGTSIEINMPTMQMLRSITDMAKDMESKLFDMAAIIVNNNDNGFQITADDVPKLFSAEGIGALVVGYLEWVTNIKNALKITFAPSDEENKVKYPVYTDDYYIVSKYTGYSFKEIEQLTVLDFSVYLRDGIIHNLSQTEKGQEYLERCWILEQTDSDRQALRELL